MPEIDIEAQLRKMRADWDQRARENARHYVDTANADWTDEEFFASGESTLSEEILTDLGNICQGKAPAEMRVLEIGCGAGRVTRALLGIGIGVIALSAAGLFLTQYITNTTLLGYNPRNAPGWTSLILAILSLSAIQLFGIGVLGEYLGRLFEETKRRPPYLVADTINIRVPHVPAALPARHAGATTPPGHL